MGIEAPPLIFGWTPTIGDPTIYGWVTVFAYAVAALLCWRAHQSAVPAEVRIWLALAAVFAALAVNKELDLQSLMTATGRAIAKTQHWYQHRRIVQSLFIAALAAAGVAGAVILFRNHRRLSGPLIGALAGTGMLFLFVLVRASSFYRVDILINKSLGSVRANHVMELGGISIVAISAVASCRLQWRSG